jgi:hypothetical protein
VNNLSSDTGNMSAVSTAKAPGFCGHTQEWWSRHRPCTECHAVYDAMEAAAIEGPGYRGIEADPTKCVECGNPATHMNPWQVGYCKTHKHLASTRQESWGRMWIKNTFKDLMRAPEVGVYRKNVLCELRGEDPYAGGQDVLRTLVRAC